MMQFKEHEIYKLRKACMAYQNITGSEYIWDEYEALIEKLNAYEEEVTPAKS